MVLSIVNDTKLAWCNAVDRYCRVDEVFLRVERFKRGREEFWRVPNLERYFLRRHDAVQAVEIADAEMLEKATPEALYLLFDTGIFNALVIGYATEAARLAGLTAKDTKAIREAVRDTLDGMIAEEIERKERKQ